MTAGYRLINIHGPLLSIDDEGNLLLDTKGREAGQIAGSNIPAFGGKGIPSQIVISNAAGTSNIADVTFQVSDLAGTAVTGNYVFDVLLSDVSTGLGLTAQSPSSAAAASGGTVLESLTASKNLRVQTNSGGNFVLAITDAGKHHYYPVAYYGGRTFIGGQLTDASYG